ncbi:Uncharacterised protein [Bacteroides eggerthii]|uniref:Uncharacterized protein n=1 Tax=Bacteroides eggerthii TaxID=28111 RepID=A0A380ZLN8_9BACE|nr:hypothetical protein [Bacteroides eggerthii]SUV47232.1 Uncharacterised protein [Bacteroides eggerthii]
MPEILNEARQNYLDDIAQWVFKQPKDESVLTPFEPLTAEGTDWFGEIRNKNALMQNYQLGISGGGQKTSFM